MCRFIEWTKAHGITINQANSIEIATFLEDCRKNARVGNKDIPPAKKNATVPKGTWTSINWWNDLAGLRLQMRSPIINGKVKRALEDHTPKEKTPFTQEMVAHVEYLVICSKNKYLKTAASWVCLLVHGCLRWSDLQRVTTDTLGISEDAIFGIARKTKTRDKMRWAADSGGICGKKWGPHAWEALVKHQVNADFILPLPVEDFTAFDWQKSAKAYHARIVMRQVLRAKPLNMSFEEASKYTLHSPRYFLPTCAGAYDFPLEKRNFIGHWSHKSTMALKYDRGFCTTELNIKNEIMKHFHNGWRLHDTSQPGVPKQTHKPLLPTGTLWSVNADDTLPTRNKPVKHEHTPSGMSDDEAEEGDGPVSERDKDGQCGGVLRTTRKASDELLSTCKAFSECDHILINPKSGIGHSYPVGCNWIACPSSKKLTIEESIKQETLLCGSCFKLRITSVISDDKEEYVAESTDEFEEDSDDGSVYEPSEDLEDLED